MTRTQPRSDSFPDSRSASAFTLSSNSLSVSCRVYVPEKHVGTTVIYCHGMQSHQKWFTDSAEHFRSRGVVVFTWDRPGSGESASEAGLRGHVSDRRLFTEALAEVIKRARFDFPRNKIYLWGNSYGAKVVASLVSEGKTQVDGLIFSTPGLFINRQTMKLPFGLLDFLFSFGKTYFPSLIPERDGDNGAGMFTDNPVYFEKIKNDQDSLRFFTKSFYMETARTDTFIRKNCRDISIPTLVLLVESDSMMVNSKTRAFFEERFKKASVKTYGERGRHEHYLMFSSGRDEAFKDIEEFVTHGN